MGGWSSVQEQRAYLAPRIQRWYPNFVTGGEQYRRLLLQHATSSTIVLDAGAGDGGYIGELRGRVKKIIGVDVHESLLSRNSSVDEKIIADLVKIPLPDNSIDLIVAEFVLEHLERPLAVFQEWRRLLKPGGVVIALTPNRNNPIMFLSRLTPTWFHQLLKRRLLKKPEHVHPTYYRANTVAQLQQLCSVSGLKLKTFVRSGNPEYLALTWVFVVPAILLERLISLPGLQWLQMYLVVTVEKHIST